VIGAGAFRCEQQKTRSTGAIGRIEIDRFREPGEQANDVLEIGDPAMGIAAP
jgi:hypothetical protein